MENVIDIPISAFLGEQYLHHEISFEERIHTLSHDSRKFIRDSWFICLKGASFDGHEYISDVMGKGAQRVIYEPQRTTLRPPGLQVPDTNLFLAELASYWRREMPARVIAVTGSNGKTSTKELLHFLLNEIFKERKKENAVLKSQGSFNNHFGLPFTLLRLTTNTDFFVVELGTNHPGEIGQLSGWASPDYSLITSIQKCHIGHFKNLEAIAGEKSDIISGMKAGSCLFYHADSEFSDLISEKANRQEIAARVISERDVPLSNVEKKVNGSSFTYRGEKYFLPMAGEHQIKNLRLCIALLERLLQEDLISSGELIHSLSRLHDFKNISGRMEFVQKGGITIYNDSYNANPPSFQAAISTLSLTFPSQKLLGAFGYMAELGTHEIEEHKSLSRLASRHFKKLAFFSPVPEVNDAFYRGWLENRSKEDIFMGTLSEEDIQQGVLFLKKFLEEEDCLLLKGSRSARMERLLESF